MPSTLEHEIRTALTQYLALDISLAEFSRRFAPLAWRAEEAYDEAPDLAGFAATIDLRLVQHADRYWSEDQLRGLLGPLAVVPVHTAAR